MNSNWFLDPFFIGLYLSLLFAIIGSKLHPISEEEITYRDRLLVLPEKEQDIGEYKKDYIFGYILIAAGVLTTAFLLIGWALPYNGCVGWHICLQMNPVGIEFVIANRFENIIVRQKQFESEDICSSFCLGAVQTIKIGVLKCLAGAGMLPVKQCVSQFMSQSRYTLGSCTIRIDADIFAVQQDGIVTQKVVAKTDVFQFDSPL